MCTYLDKVGSTYYFRRPVPKHLLGYFRTASGAVRTEWKYSLGVKDREQAKRLLPVRAIETDRLTESAEVELAVSAASPHLSLCEREEREVERREAAAKAERFDGRSELRMLMRQRLKLTTQHLSPKLAVGRRLWVRL